MIEVPRPRVLVIGGTQFIGRATVAALIGSGRYDVTILNRGRTESPFEGSHHRHVCCDRRKKALKAFLEAEPAWHAVIDFVAFGPDDVRRMLPLAAKLGLYVLISTDSVYMACDPAGWRRDPTSGRLLEQSDAQPDAARGALDEYGASKLALEQCLTAHAELRFVALRLPDVLGRHENTGRQEKLLKRLMGGRSIGTAAEPGGDGAFGRQTPLSVVFADDVAQAVLELVDTAATAAGAEGLAGARLHLCTDEAPTWVDLVAGFAEALVAEGLKVPPPAFDASKDTRFVSVECGALDNGAAKRLLPRWRPAPLGLRLRETVSWWIDEQRAAFEEAQKAQAAEPEGGEECSDQGSGEEGSGKEDGGEDGGDAKRSRTEAPLESFKFGFGDGYHEC